MSIQTRLRETSDVGGGGGGSTDSAGLAGTGATYILSSLAVEFPDALYIKPGSSVTTHITGSNLFINATTSTFAGSSGLAGKDAVYVLSSYNSEYTNAVYIRPGSSVTTHITGSNLFINATTSAGASSGGRGFVQLLPQQAKLYPSNSAARIDAGTAWWRLLFSSTTQQYGIWQFIVPYDYSSNPYIRLAWAVGSTFAVVTSNTWTVEQFGISHDITILPASYLYLDTFGGANSITIGLSAGYSSGTVQFSTIPLATVVSLDAGNLTKFRISNTGQSVGDRILAGATFEYSR